MKDKSKKDAFRKKPYTKPAIKQVQLKPEEAVLGGCKTSTSPGPARITCDFGVGQCNSIIS
jgi:hypothetical protein